MSEADFAIRIASYWSQRGFRVLPVVVTEKGVSVVRSDMVSGLPRGISPKVKCDVAMPLRRRKVR